MGPSHASPLTISDNAPATALGVEGWGVATRIRSENNSPFTASTRATFIPEPPMSTPNMSMNHSPLFCVIKYPIFHRHQDFDTGFA
jgi:hypothetical protein